MIAILGGGISGLAAAYELTTRRIPFILFEASDRVGGLVRTEHAGGFTIEAGADSMLAQKRAGLELCAELGLGSRLLPMKPPRTAFVLHRGRLYPLPSPSMFGVPTTWKGLAGFQLLSPAGRMRLALEPIVPARAAADDESIASFFRRRFGAGSVGMLAQPLLGGIHAGDVEALSLRALVPRLADAERSGTGVLRWMRQTVRHTDSGGAFRSLAAGMSELVDGIRRRLPEDAVRTGAPARAIVRDGAAWRITTDEGTVSCRAVIFACPASVAGSLLAPIDAGAADLCGRVRYVSTASIALAWPRAQVGHPLAGSGFVVARQTSDVRVTACTWVSSKWDSRAPAGHVLLRAYIGGAHDAHAVDVDDDSLIALAVRELSAILSITGAPELARVYRWRNAGAQHEVGHLALVTELEQRLARHHGLFVTGSGFRTIGIPDCIADGRAVAADAGVFANEA